MGDFKLLNDRSHKDGEKLTRYERDFIEENQKCPDCETGDLEEGPHGGQMVNKKCKTSDCGSEFNLLILENTKVIFGQRISDPQPNLKST